MEFKNKKSVFAKEWDLSHIDTELVWLKQNVVRLNKQVELDKSCVNDIVEHIDELLTQNKNEIILQNLLKEYKELMNINKQELKKKEKLMNKKKELSNDVKKYPDSLVIPIKKDKE